MRLRNYIIHNGMPFTKITSAIYEDCNLYIDRNDLLNGLDGALLKMI